MCTRKWDFTQAVPTRGWGLAMLSYLLTRAGRLLFICCRGAKNFSFLITAASTMINKLYAAQHSNHKYPRANCADVASLCASEHAALIVETRARVPAAAKNARTSMDPNNKGNCNAVRSRNCLHDSIDSRKIQLHCLGCLLNSGSGGGGKLANNLRQFD